MKTLKTRNSKKLDYRDLISINMPFRKKDLMELVYSKDELKNIDASIPINSIDANQDSFDFVMNYNDNSVFGKLENMLEIAYEKGIVLASKLYSYNQFK